MRRIVAASLLSLGMLSAHAESYLFPTDILGAGALDLELTISHSEHSENINFQGNPGREAFESTTEVADIRYGLGHDLHVGIALPYASYHAWTIDYSTPAAHFVDQRGEGKQNLRAWAKYGFVNDKSNPLSVSGEILIAPNTSGRSSSATGSLIAGWKSSDTLRLYGALSLTKEGSSANADGTSLTLGAYKEVAKGITLIPEIGYTHFSSTDFVSPIDEFSIGLASHIEVSKDTYVSPRVSLFRISSVSTSDGTFHQAASTNGQSAGISLYHSF